MLDIRRWMGKCWAGPASTGAHAASAISGQHYDQRLRSPRSTWLAGLRFRSPVTGERFRSIDESTERVAGHLPRLQLVQPGSSKCESIVDSDGCPESPPSEGWKSDDGEEATGLPCCERQSTIPAAAASGQTAGRATAASSTRPRSAVQAGRMFPIFGCPPPNASTSRHRPHTASPRQFILQRNLANYSELQVAMISERGTGHGNKCCGPGTNHNDAAHRGPVSPVSPAVGLGNDRDLGTAAQQQEPELVSKRQRPSTAQPAAGGQSIVVDQWASMRGLRLDSGDELRYGILISRVCYFDILHSVSNSAPCASDSKSMPLGLSWQDDGKKR